MQMHLSSLSYLLYNIVEDGVVAGFIDMNAVAAAKACVHATGGVTQGCGNIDIAVACSLDRLLNSCVVAIYLIVRRKA